MRYSDICQAFYITEEESDSHVVESGLLSKKSQGDIAEYIITIGWSSESTEGILPDNISTYNKWYYGKTGQRAKVWDRFRKDYEEKNFAQILEDELNPDVLPKVLKKLGIKLPVGKRVNKHRLALAIARQMYVFATSKKANNEADSIIEDTYFGDDENAKYLEYIKKAIERYNVMKLVGGEEVPLEDFFVCNTIGASERVFTDKNAVKGEYLEDPDMDSIRKIFKKRGYDNLRTKLIGSGGCGKTLMLQHLFLKSAEDYANTGVLPIFLELRHFTQSDDIFSYAVKTVRAKDVSFEDGDAKILMMNGKCQLFMDGFDEIDPSDLADFLKKIEAFSDRYDKVQIIITSRQNESLTGLHNYTSLYVWPFGNEQSMKLIDKILSYQGEMGAREEVIKYINHGFLKKDGVFASHPLLLTYVTMKYPSFNKFNEEPSLFYKETYEALLSGHDDNKKPYDRVFMSVDDAEQFSKVFREFCGITYKDGVKQFDSMSFEDYYNKLEVYKGFVNPHKMNIKNFKHDVCSTACMMYEKESDILYIDPGFQECLFAEYYAVAADREKINDLRSSLQCTSYAKLERFEALDMFYKASELKFKFWLLLPFLDSIFEGNDDQAAFANFLHICFDEITVVDVDIAMQIFWQNQLGLKNVLYPQVENYPKTILLNYLLKLMGENTDFEFCLYMQDNTVSNNDIHFLNIPKDAAVSGVVLGQITEVNGEACLLIDCKPMAAYEYLQNQQLQVDYDLYINDEKGKFISFGKRITLEGYYLMNEPDEFGELVENVMHNSNKTYELFEQIKNYYRRLKVEKHRSGIK